MYQDEFEAQFARAKVDEEYLISCYEQHQRAERRGSLPSVQPLFTLSVEEGHHRRAASCKLPGRRKRSPRHQSVEGDSNVPNEGEDTTVSFEYVKEPMLRAPSPMFSKKCQSAPHSRSSSWRKSHRPTSKYVEDEIITNVRKGSVPFEEEVTAKLEELKQLHTDDLLVVRNFKLSTKGLVNRGDSFKRKHLSNASIASDSGPNSGTGSLNASVPGTPSNSEVNDDMFSKVIIAGSHGVGKTALLQQFMTSNYMGAVATGFDEAAERNVSVQVDGVETNIQFVDIDPKRTVIHPKDEKTAAYVLVYSINERETYEQMLNTMYQIRKEAIKDIAIIIVANKADLVRTRSISSEEAMKMCLLYHCKYIEVSAALNHKVDDLLVGIVTQIRLNSKRGESKPLTLEEQKNSNCVKSAKGIFSRIFKKDKIQTNTCDNLLTL